MIIVNYYQEEDYNPETDGYHLNLAAVVNDTLDLINDIEQIKDAIDNSSEFEPKNGTLYELHLDRAVINYSHPAREYTFSLTNIVEMKYSPELGHHKPLIDLS